MRAATDPQLGRATGSATKIHSQVKKAWRTSGTRPLIAVVAVLGLLAITGLTLAAAGAGASSRNATLLDATSVSVHIGGGREAAFDVWVDSSSDDVIAEVAVPSLDGLPRSTLTNVLRQVWEQVPGRFDRVIVRDILRSREWRYQDLEAMFGARDALNSADRTGDGTAATRVEPGDCIKDPHPPAGYEGQVLCSEAPTAMVSAKTIFALGDLCPGLMVQPVAVNRVYREPNGAVSLIMRVGLPTEFSGLVTMKRPAGSGVLDVFCNLLPGAKYGAEDTARHFLDLETLQEVTDPDLRRSVQPSSTGSSRAPALPATPNDRWSDPTLWDMDCTNSVDPTRVDVHHVAKGDATGDGTFDTVVAASCYASTSAWADSVALFDGASSDSATFINADIAPRRPIIESLSVEGGKILVEGTLTSWQAPLCCPDLRFADTYVVTGEEWRRLDHNVWPKGQAETTGQEEPDLDDLVGYGEVKIGMTSDQLFATGQVTERDQGGGCTWYDLSYGGEVVYSQRLGKVVAIFFEGEMTTSKGIRMGSSKTEMISAYPGARHLMPWYWTTEVTSDVEYAISLNRGHVASLVLQSKDQDCFG